MYVEWIIYVVGMRVCVRVCTCAVYVGMITPATCALLSALLITDWEQTRVERIGSSAACKVCLHQHSVPAGRQSVWWTFWPVPPSHGQSG